MVLGHVLFQRVGVAAFRWFPSRDFVGGIEVVGEILAVAMANFPARREAGFDLWENWSAFFRGNFCLDQAKIKRHRMRCLVLTESDMAVQVDRGGLLGDARRWTFRFGNKCHSHSTFELAKVWREWWSVRDTGSATASLSDGQTLFR